MTRAISIRSKPLPSGWTRPQQLLTAGYGVWAAVWTGLLAVFLENPARETPVMLRQGFSPEAIRASNEGYLSGLGLVAFEAVVYLLVAYFAYRGKTWSFWVALVTFGVTGLGAIWVPLQPMAHAGMDTPTLILHAFVNDLPGLLLTAFMLVGLVRYGRSWARHRPKGKPQ